MRLKLSPFLGVMGMPLDLPGPQSTFPPTPCGGNMDCCELTEGATLFLPIAVAGDCSRPATVTRCRATARSPDPRWPARWNGPRSNSMCVPSFAWPCRARIAEGWLTFGFHRDLNEAWMIAAREMMRLMEESRPEDEGGLSLAGLVATSA